MWLDRAICVFHVRAVGSYFSQVTGWPPGSLGVWIAVFYTFMPAVGALRRDDEGRLLPLEVQGHMRSHLDCGLDQELKVRDLPNPKDRERRDIFWVDRDGGNAPQVAGGIAASLCARGLPWFSRMSNAEQALADTESARDCFVKFDKAAFLARELGDRDRWEKYARLAEAEAQRIQRPIARVERYGI